MIALQPSLRLVDVPDSTFEVPDVEFRLYAPTRTFIFLCVSPAEKKTWFSVIQACIKSNALHTKGRSSGSGHREDPATTPEPDYEQLYTIEKAKLSSTGRAKKSSAAPELPSATCVLPIFSLLDKDIGGRSQTDKELCLPSSFQISDQPLIPALSLVTPPSLISPTSGISPLTTGLTTMPYVPSVASPPAKPGITSFAPPLHPHFSADVSGRPITMTYIPAPGMPGGVMCVPVFGPLRGMQQSPTQFWTPIASWGPPGAPPAALSFGGTSSETAAVSTSNPPPANPPVTPARDSLVTHPGI